MRRVRPTAGWTGAQGSTGPSGPTPKLRPSTRWLRFGLLTVAAVQAAGGTVAVAMSRDFPSYSASRPRGAGIAELALAVAFFVVAVRSRWAPLPLPSRFATAALVAVSVGSEWASHEPATRQLMGHVPAALGTVMVLLLLASSGRRLL